MAIKQTLQQIKSPVGELYWAHLRTPEEWQGQSTGYLTVQAKFSKEDTDKLIEMLENAFEAAKKTEKFNNWKPARRSVPNLGTKELPNGDIVFKFKTKAEYTNKQGETIKRTVPVFDAAGKPMENPIIGNGSLGRIAFSLNPQCTSSTNYGITPYLDAIQILKLVEYINATDASQFGFEVEEDYISNDNDDVNFDENADFAASDDNEGDF